MQLLGVSGGDYGVRVESNGRYSINQYRVVHYRFECWLCETPVQPARPSDDLPVDTAGLYNSVLWGIAYR